MISVDFFLKNWAEPWPVLKHFLILTQHRGVSHCGLAIYIKRYFKAKGELWKLKYFTMQKYNLEKSSCKNRPIIT
jgi:hypothetical protein